MRKMINNYAVINVNWIIINIIINFYINIIGKRAMFLKKLALENFLLIFGTN